MWILFTESLSGDLKWAYKLLTVIFSLLKYILLTLNILLNVKMLYITDDCI
jgi:hypothetical protein